MDVVAFAPRDGYTADNCGVIAFGDTEINVRAELETGNGTIVVPESDQAKLSRLDDYLPLERVKVTKKLEKLAEKLETKKAEEEPVPPAQENDPKGKE